MTRYRQHASGSVIDTTTDRLVGRVLTPQGARGINGPAFYRLDQLAGNASVSTVPLPEEAANGLLLGRRGLDEVVAEALA